MQLNELDKMVDGYIKAMLFTADEDLIPPKSGQFDDSPYLDRIPRAMREKAKGICKAFAESNLADLGTYDADDAGIDLWFTQNHHGCGFWECDHCNDEEGERLTTNAHAVGEMYLFRMRGGWFYFE